VVQVDSKQAKDGSLVPALPELTPPSPMPPVIKPAAKMVVKAAPAVQQLPAPALPEGATQTQGQPQTSSFLSLNGKVKDIINHAKVVMNYEIEGKGQSGVGKVEIWATRDHGQSWQRLAEDPDKQSPAEFELPEEGVYGITVVASNGLGFGGDPPKTGDAPDWVVELDTTAPRAELLSVRPIPGVHAGMMLVTWTASDKNLSTEPIDLHYATNAAGPWHVIAKGLKNTGQYRWQVPHNVRGGILVKMTVSDLAGNVAEAQTAQAVQVDDLSRPHVRVIGVDHPHSSSGVNGN
jgi:hypothetical protein